LTVGVQAQSGSAQAPVRPVNPTGAAPVTIDSLTTHKLTSTDNTARLTTVTDAAHRAEPSNSPPLAEPKVDLMHPRLGPDIQPRGAKLDTLSFAEPDQESETAPLGFEATAYNLRGRTASGVYVRRGVLAADPRVLPIGSLVQVKAGDYSGIYTVHDTGRRIRGRTVDIWMPSSREARSFGRRRVKLQVLRYGPRHHKTKH